MHIAAKKATVHKQDHAKESSEDSDKENDDILNIQNPAVIVPKDRPHTARLKSATESGTRGQKGRKVLFAENNELNGIKRKCTECQYR